MQNLKERLEQALAGLLESGRHADHAIIMNQLTAAHAGAQRMLKNPEAGHPGSVAWEIVHGLSLLKGHDIEAEARKFSCDETIVLKDGSLLGFCKWELLDPGWLEALVKWVEHLHHRHDFATNPAVIEVPNTLSLGIVGDWGTGPFEDRAPATLVGQVLGGLDTDYTIHLGDVYYAGSGSEEDNNMAAWPQGTQGSFTLNSNHEMYDGAFGYFSELARRFPLQQETSYFALYNDHWLIVGLDSAYAAEAKDLYMTGNLNQTQLDWLGTLPKRDKVMVFSHHEGWDQLGNKPTALNQQVIGALGQAPDYWYWGHIHAGIIYQPVNRFHGRCIGHGAIPYGNARELEGDPAVAWYETELADDPHYPERVLNGLVKVDLDGPSIEETVIGEDGSTRWSTR